MDPAELRRKNFIQPEQFPHTTQMGTVYDSAEYERLLDETLELADWEQLKAERDAARAEGRLVGLGMSFYAEICGLAPSAGLPTTGGWEHASVTIERDGKIFATTGSSPHGQGNETTFAQILGDEFGVPIDDITIAHGDTDVVRHGIGTFGSRSQAVGGTTLKLAGEKVRVKMAKFAAQMLEANEEDIVFADGLVSVAGVPDSGIPFSESRHSPTFRSRCPETPSRGSARTRSGSRRALPVRSAATSPRSRSSARLASSSYRSSSASTTAATSEPPRV